MALHHHHLLPLLLMENKSQTLPCSLGMRLINVRSFSYKLRSIKNLLLRFLVSPQHVRYGLHFKLLIAMLPLNVFIGYVIIYVNSTKTFSTTIRATKPAPLFRDVVSQSESHELFRSSLHGTITPSAAFNAQHNITNSQDRGHAFSSRCMSSRGQGCGLNFHPPHYQLCQTNGHYASSCPSLASYATQASSTDESLAKAFHAQCRVTTNSLNWHVDSGATDHMTSSCDSLHQSAPYKVNANVLFRNGHILLITNTGPSIISNNNHLRNVLVIPHLTKKLLSISKLTTDYPVDVLFSQPFFLIQVWNTKQVLARGSCENGLYVLKDEHHALVSTTCVPKKASYELWHALLGHVSFDVISVLNKLGGLAPICSKDGYRYYVAFIDD
ncbi:zinc finger, CCHC-type containing LTR copia-type gag-polypeptide [Tanacetum coccineum]|uniref:Zinc finger, CCHC-type containing LTR copia-type gag-polypeptide n=1 Tax=Tanacetum coccineum TaxID=301880 RepID=A0ABQ5EYD4_9ASTR